MEKYIDLRDPMDYAAGHIPGAVNITPDRILLDIGKVATPEDSLLLYCYSGNRSRLAQELLKTMGYRAKSIGGIHSYKGALEK